MGLGNRFFQYGEVEVNYLKKKDKKLGVAMERIGMIRREVNPDLFSALVYSIIGQQISTKAVQTIWQRMCDGIGEIRPESILSCEAEELQSYGMSFRKVAYIQGTAKRVVDGSLDIEGLREKGDEEVYEELVEIPGIGRWTAEMLMLFSMERPDVLSYGDLGIINGLKILYGHKEVGKERFERYRRRYSPYGSVASLYLWAIAGGGLEG